MEIEAIRFTRSSNGRYEVIQSADLNVWKSKTFNPPVTKLRVWSDGGLGLPTPIIEIKLNDIDGSFIIGVAHELEIDNHIVDKIEYRVIQLDINDVGLFSVLGLRPSVNV